VVHLEDAPFTSRAVVNSGLLELFAIEANSFIFLMQLFRLRRHNAWFSERTLEVRDSSEKEDELVDDQDESARGVGEGFEIGKNAECSDD